MGRKKKKTNDVIDNSVNDNSNDMFQYIENDELEDYSSFEYVDDQGDIYSDYENLMSQIDDQESPLEILENIEYENTSEVIYDTIDNWEDEYHEDITDKLSRKGKRTYTKEEENPYKKEFAEELSLYYELLEDSNKLCKKLDKKFDTMEKSKTKGVSKYTTDIINAMLSANTNKLQTIKEITTLKKTICELNIKKDKNSPQQQGDGSLESAANQYFSQIMSVGRNNFITALSNDDTSIDSEYGNDDIDYTKSLSEAHSSIQDRISERLQQEGVSRSEEADKYIMYENLNAKLIVKYNVLNNDWKIVAVDEHEQEILDYPVPTRQELGKVKFSADNRYMTDKYSRTYKVIEIYS